MTKTVTFAIGQNYVLGLTNDTNYIYAGYETSPGRTNLHSGSTFSLSMVNTDYSELIIQNQNHFIVNFNYKKVIKKRYSMPGVIQFQEKLDKSDFASISPI